MKLNYQYVQCTFLAAHLKKTWSRNFLTIVLLATLQPANAQTADTSTQSDQNESYLKKQIAAAELEYGQDHACVYPRLLELATYYKTHDRWSDAERVYQRVSKIQEEHGRHGKQTTVDGLLGLKEVYQNEKSPTQFAAVEKRIHEIQFPAAVDEPIQLKSAKDADLDDQMIKLFQSADQQSPAGKQKVALQIIKLLSQQSPGARSTATAVQAQSLLARALDAQMKTEPAQVEFEKLLLLARKDKSPGGEETAYRQAVDFYIHHRQYQKALDINLAVLPLVQNREGDCGQTCASIYSWLMDYFIKQQDSENAKKWCDKLIYLQTENQGPNSPAVKDLEKRLLEIQDIRKPTTTAEHP
jgi:hypothetical protein